MKTIHNPAKKKLKTSMILFIVALSCLAVGIILFMIGLSRSHFFGSSEGVGNEGGGYNPLYPAFLFIGLILLIGGSITLLVSAVKNLTYRKNSVKPGKLSEAMFIVAWVLQTFSMLIIFMIKHVMGENIFRTGKKGLRTITVKEGKNEYVLTQAFEGSEEYQDQLGYEWKTTDCGMTFERTKTAGSEADAEQDVRYTKRSEKKNLKDPANKSLKVSVILLIVAAVGLGIGIVLIAAGMSVRDTVGTALIATGGSLIMVSYIVFLISSLMNLSYRKSALVPGKLSTVMFVVSCIVVLPIIVFMFVMGLVSMGGGETVRIKDADGNEYVLTQIYMGGNEYRDQYGDTWRTPDGGKTFQRVSTNRVKTKDENGNEITLTHTHDGFLSKNYRGDDGEEYVSKDGGKTFEQLISKATVTDANGNEYNLKASQAGINRFIDQNGDVWVTNDDGKTFERWK